MQRYNPGVPWHPSDQEIELYSLGRLRQDDGLLEPLEEHMLICSLCQDRLAEADTYLAALREALGTVDGGIRAASTADIFAIHQTTEGQIYLWVDERGNGRWMGRVTGISIDSGSDSATSEEAMRVAEAVFHQMFPEHICVPGCIGQSAERRSA